MPGGKGVLNSHQSGQLTILGKMPLLQLKNLQDTEDCFEQWLVQLCLFISSNVQLLQHYAFFLVQPHLISVCLLVFLLFVFMCVWLFCFLFCWILVVFLSFQSSPPSAMVNQKMVFNPSKAQSLRPAKQTALRTECTEQPAGAGIPLSLSPSFPILPTFYKPAECIT